MSKHLKFSMVPGTDNLRWAQDNEAGLHFVIQRCDGDPDGTYRIEISDTEPSGRSMRVEHVERLDTARRLCEQRVALRLADTDA